MPQPPNLGALLQQAQKMQEEMLAAQEKLKDERVEASAGGGMVKVVMTGDLELKSLAIDPDAVDPEDVEMLQDMVMAAINEALRQAMELQAKATAARAAWTRPRRSTRSAAWAASAASAAAAAAGCPGGGAAQPRRAPQAEVARLLAPPLQRLVTELGKLPGIGNRTAQRLAFHLLRASAGGRATRSPTRSATSRSASGSARSASTSPRARAARSASTSAATRR